LDYVGWGLILYRREMKGGGDGDGDGDSEFRDPSECQVHLLVMLISDNKINGDSKDMILSTGSVISDV